MPAKIRLQRKGRKARPFYTIVVTDSRSPRDGRYIERIGSYNPVTHPATIELDFDKALVWLQKGAQITDTCRSILSAQGVFLKKHLLEGAKKGAFSPEEAEKRFENWMKEKESRIEAEKENVNSAKAADQKKRMDDEVKVKEARAAEIAKRKSDLAAAEAKANAAPAEVEVEEVVSENEVTPEATEEAAE